LRVLIEALAGLHYAHDLTDFDGTPLEVVHRDATPHNVFITYDGQVKLLDFGIAKALSSTHHTRTEILKGKVSYMAPEQTRGEEVDRRADVFAAGVMLWEAATGQRLWKGANEIAVLHARIAGDAPRPSTINARVNEDLEHIVMRALAKHPADRYAS